MKVIHETLRVHMNVISPFVLILFGDKHQLTNMIICWKMENVGTKHGHIT
jgi:hypothetical protein